MTTTYLWVIAQLDTKPQEGNLTDVVSTIHWRRQATAINGEETYFADTYGSVACPSPSDTDFTAYPDLTYEQVCEWLDSLLDVATIDAGLDANIALQINPPIIVLPLPWDSQPV